MKKRSGLQSKRRSVREFLDFDYLGELSPEQTDWLAQFCVEYYSTDVFKKAYRRGLHRTDKLKRELHADNNARNRDAWNRLDRVAIDQAQPVEQSDGDDE